MGYPPPPPQGVYPCPPFPAAQEASDGAGYMRTVYYDHVPALRPKRKQSKIACTNCAHACKRCDERRPCQRCVRYKIEETCVDTQRKERKKGIKRGPYKRREKPLATEHIPDAELLPGPAPPPALPGPAPPPGFYPMYFPPPHFIPCPPTQDAHPSHAAAPPPPHDLAYFLPPYGYPFLYPGPFQPPPPAPVPNEQRETDATAAAPAVGVVPGAVTLPVEKRRSGIVGKAAKKAEASPAPTPIEAPVASEPDQDRGRPCRVR
ncbi:hypothetical protein C0989_003975 [Termitomyces sp. Mn162]|nr:hypothetical protein C0989_003975 [Termitomyces sp. Mn162]